MTGWHLHRHRPGLELPYDTTNTGGDFYLATRGDLQLATSGDFFMATDNSHEGSFGSWVLPKPIDQNTMALGYSTMGPLLETVYDFAYAQGFILPFDWMTWMETEGEQTRTNPTEQLSRRTLTETLGLVTAIFRSDRFNEGALLEAFDNGTMPKLFRHLLTFRES